MSRSKVKVIFEQNSSSLSNELITDLNTRHRKKDRKKIGRGKRDRERERKEWQAL